MTTPHTLSEEQINELAGDLELAPIPEDEEQERMERAGWVGHAFDAQFSVLGRTAKEQASAVRAGVVR